MAAYPSSYSRPILVLALTTLTLPALRAQEFRGAITGTISDPQGAAVPGAAVAALNVDTNTTQNTVTNDSGVRISLCGSRALQRFSHRRRLPSRSP